jgi:hypothetical protein
MTEKQTLTPIEAINEFYRLKEKYEKVYYEKYVMPIIKSDKSKREKRVEYSKLPKHECINCKRHVNTIFKVSSDIVEFIKIFVVKCGDFQDPCPLDIQINYAFRDQFDKIIKEGLEKIEIIKLQIIKEKNNALFFGQNVVNIFEKLTQKLTLETEVTGFSIETNLLRNNNPEIRDLLKKMIDEFGKGCIIPFKQMIKEYMDTSNELILNQATNFYINEMIPKLKEIQVLKYKVNIVEFDNTYKLIQLPNSLESTEFFYENEDKVIKFIKGVRKEKKKTKKEDNQPNKFNKTRKMKRGEIILEEDEGEEEIVEEEIADKSNLKNKYAEEPLYELVYNESGERIIEWKNTEYNKLWKQMPEQLKNLLMEDIEWLEDFMNECIKSRKSGNSCELFLPKQTLFPPRVLENGKYDFESEIVNKLFNGLSKSHQDRLLKLYFVKDGVTNYDMLKNSLTTLLEQNINSFNRGRF